jgi:hypothetical protein
MAELDLEKFNQRLGKLHAHFVKHKYVRDGEKKIHQMTATRTTYTSAVQQDVGGIHTPRYPHHVSLHEREDSSFNAFVTHSLVCFHSFLSLIPVIPFGVEPIAYFYTVGPWTMIIRI